MSQISTLQDLFEHGLFDTYNAEHQITQALPRMKEKATNRKLADGFATHLEETENQIEKLEQVFEMLELKPEKEVCEAMRGIIEEGEKMMEEVEKGPVLDSALISAAQKVEHYEISAYGTLCALAETLGLDEAKEILVEILEEEKATDEKLTRLAEQDVNQEANAA